MSAGRVKGEKSPKAVLHLLVFGYAGVMDENHSDNSKSHKNPGLSQAERNAAERRERAAVKLRENLQRRKQQSRARRAGEAAEETGLPAAKMDESS